MPKSSNITNKIILILFSLASLWVFYLLLPILLPFFLAALFAYMCDPLVLRLMRLKMSRIVAVLIVFTSLLTVLGVFIWLLIPLIQTQINAFISVFPAFINWLQNSISNHLLIPLGFQNLSHEITVKNFLADNATKAGGVASMFTQTIWHSSKTLFEGILYLILVPVVTFYLLRDWDMIIASIQSLIPEKNKVAILKITQECDQVLGGFFRGQLLVMLSLGIFYSITLTLLGLDVGIAVGLFVGVLSIIPYLGFFIGLFIAVIATTVQFQNLTTVLIVLLIFFIGHSLENLFLTPRYVGSRIGLHPVAVIFAILAGGSLFGIFGVLFALPVASILMVLLRHLYWYYTHEDEDLAT